MCFQNGCNKVAIELCVLQFWSEIILVISNRTRAAHSFNFENGHMISDQTVLHSVQLPLLILVLIISLTSKEAPPATISVQLKHQGECERQFLDCTCIPWKQHFQQQKISIVLELHQLCSNTVVFALDHDKSDKIMCCFRQQVSCII